MATIVLAYDPDRYWDQFLKKHHLRHETFANDDQKFILYFHDDDLNALPNILYRQRRCSCDNMLF